MDLSTTTSEWLAQEMKRQNISKHELVRRTGISYSTITRMLTKPNTGNLATWLVVCGALGVCILDAYNES